MLTWLRWELNTSLISLTSIRKNPGGQPQSKFWASQGCLSGEHACEHFLGLRLDISQLKGRHLLLSLKSIRTWLRERRVEVGSDGCQTTFLRTQSVLIHRPHQLPLTRIGLTLPIRRLETWQMTYTTLTSDCTPMDMPLARLTVLLEGLSKQIDRFQILATNRYPEADNRKVLQTATYLTGIYLADTIA